MMTAHHAAPASLRCSPRTSPTQGEGRTELSNRGLSVVLQRPSRRNILLSRLTFNRFLGSATRCRLIALAMKSLPTSSPSDTAADCPAETSWRITARCAERTAGSIGLCREPLGGRSPSAGFLLDPTEPPQLDAPDVIRPLGFSSAATGLLGHFNRRRGMVWTAGAGKRASPRARRGRDK